MRHIQSLKGPSVNSRDTLPTTIQYSTIGYIYDIGLELDRYFYSSRQITGINVPLVIGADYDDSICQLYYRINAGISNGNNYELNLPPTMSGFSAINPGATFSISNNQYLDFGGIPFSTSTSDWANLYNQTFSSNGLSQLCAPLSFTDGSF